MSEFSQNEGFLVPRSRNMDLVPSTQNQKVISKGGRKEIILEEDQHIKNLESILNRDFFPLLTYANNQEGEDDKDISTNLSTIDPGIENTEIENLSLNQYVHKYNR